MKRLGVYAFVGLLLVSIFGGFVTREKTHAQSTVAKTIAQYETQGKSLFNVQLAALNQKRANPAATGTIPATLPEIDALIAAVTKASSVFSTTLNSGGGAAGDVYLKALIAGKDAVSEEQRNNFNTLRKPYPTNVIRLFTAQLDTEAFAEKKYIALIAGGYTAEEAQIDRDALANSRAGAVAAVTEGKKAPPSKCSLFGVSAIVDCLDIGITWIIKNTLLQIAGFALWLTANMFNYAVKIGILEFASWASNDLYPIWVIVRQIVSLIIVFIGLYLGLMYILGKDGFQKYLPWVIMFALFVNFSYPLTRTAIDISNIISLKIYVSAVGPGALDNEAKDTAGAQILSKLGLQELAFSATSAKDGEPGGMLGAVDSTPGALLAVVYVAYAAYIFFMVTALIIMRTAALIFIIVASPLLLVDAVLPMLGEKAKDLRKIFFEQLAVGPIFMIMLALTLKFLDVFNTSGKLKNGGFGADATTSGGMPTVIVFFNILMMLIMLWIMLKVTKQTAGALGKYATDAMGTVGGYATGAATGMALAGTGMLARKGLGGLAAKVRDSDWVKKNPDSIRGRLAYNLSNSVASSSFDLRNSAVAQKYAGKLGISSGMGAGTKMGYDEENKKKVEAIAARGARIKTHYERDLIKDGKVIARKGEIDPEAVATKERFYQNKGGAIFLTQKQQEELNAGFLDETNSKDMGEYKKLTNKADKLAFADSLHTQLDALKNTGEGRIPKAQALMRSIFDIDKQEKEEKKSFDLQVEKEIDRYNRTSTAKRVDYLARLDKDMADAVKGSIDQSTGDASVDIYRNSINPPAPSSTPVTSLAPIVPPRQTLTGDALRQERIQKVEEGRAQQVQQIKDSTDANFSELYEANIEQAVIKQEVSAAKAVVFAENRNLNIEPVASVAPDVEKVDYAAKFAATRKEAQARATQVVRDTEIDKPTASSSAASSTSPTPKSPVTPPVTV